MLSTGDVGGDSFRHAAWAYRTDEQYTNGIGRFVAEGLAADLPVQVAVPGEKLRLLSPALGADIHRVEVINMATLGRNPGRLLREVQTFIAAHPGGVRVVAEPLYPGRSSEEYAACLANEVLINHVLAGTRAMLVCPYDTARLPPAWITEAAATHPWLAAAAPGQCQASTDYAPERMLAVANQPLPIPAGAATMEIDEITQLGLARHLAAQHASQLAGRHERIDEHTVALVVTELVTNSLTHAHTPAQVALWRDTQHIICQVSDHGQLTDPLPTGHPQSPTQPGGRGLALVHALSDLVRTHTSPTGTTVRAYLRCA